MNPSIYKLLAGRIFTNIADSIVYMAVLWYINENFRSGLILSLVFIISSGVDMLSFLLGPLVDRKKLSKIVYISAGTQILATALVAILLMIQQKTILVVVVLLILHLIVTICSAILYPSESKILPLVVKRNNMAKVNSLFQLSYKSLDVLLNAFISLLIVFMSIDQLIILSTLIFLLAYLLYNLLFGKRPDLDIIDDNSENYFTAMKMGFKELKKHKKLLELITPLIGVNFFYAIAVVGLPKFASTFVSQSATSYGFLLLVSAVGSIVGSAVYPIIEKVKLSQRHLVIICLSLSGISWILIPSTITYSIIISYAGLFLSSFFIAMMNIAFLTLVQTTINPLLLGRVSTINESILSAVIPLGNLIGGLLISSHYILLTQYLYGGALIFFSVTYLFVRETSANKLTK